MKFDYDLIKKIGVHYYAGNTPIYAKYIAGSGWHYFNSSRNAFMHLELPDDLINELIKPIPPRPQLEYEYVEVDDVKPGERIYWLDDGEYKSSLVIGWHPEHPMVVIECYEDFGCVCMDNLYCRVEKPKPDWKKVARDFVSLSQGLTLDDSLDDFFGYQLPNQNNENIANEFLELCVEIVKAAKEAGEIE